MWRNWILVGYSQVDERHRREYQCHYSGRDGTRILVFSVDKLASMGKNIGRHTIEVWWSVLDDNMSIALASTIFPFNLRNLDWFVSPTYVGRKEWMLKSKVTHTIIPPPTNSQYHQLPIPKRKKEKSKAKQSVRNLLLLYLFPK